jgi:hypothetical protein
VSQNNTQGTLKTLRCPPLFYSRIPVAYAGSMISRPGQTKKRRKKSGKEGSENEKEIN